jgi:hypothetical protein
MKNKVNEETIKNYYINHINDVKECINVIKTYESNDNQKMIFQMLLHLLLLISFVENMVFHIMHMPLKNPVS